MDVFSLVKFWRNAGVGDLDINTDEEGSFFDLVFTNPNDVEGNDSPNVLVINSGGDHHYHKQCYCSKLDGADLKSNHMTYSSPSLFNINKRKVLPLDTTTKSPFRVFMLGFQNPKFKRSDDSCNQMPSKRFSKDVVHRYLNLIKPLYTRRSNDEKVRLSVHSGRSVFKHLGKSRSSSSVVKPFPSPAATARRDDSADGIQGAILHCKKSYNSPSQGSGLSRSASAPSQGTRISVDEQEKRSSI